jgi:uncharacterized protein (TIGR02588 family)
MTSDQNTPDSRPVIEWVLAAISACAIALLVGFLVFQALFGESRPAALAVLSRQAQATESGTLLWVEIANTGDRAAAGVRVLARAPGAPPAEGLKHIEFDYLAPHSVRRGAFTYAAGLDPAGIEIAIEGYVEP